MPVSPQEFLQAIQTDPKIKARFNARPEGQRQAVLDMLWETTIRSKLPRGIPAEQEQSAKQVFVDRMLGRDKGPIAAPEPERTMTTTEPVGGPNFATKVAEGAMSGSANVASLAGMIPNSLSEGLQNIAESYKKGSGKYEQEHPYRSGAAEMIGQALPAVATEAVAGALKAGPVLKTAAGMLPFSNTPTQLAVGTGAGLGLGKALRYIGGKFFPKVATEAATAASAATNVGTEAAGATVEPSAEAVAAPFVQKSASEIMSMTPSERVAYNEAREAGEAVKRTAAQAAKGAQIIEKKGLRAEKAAQGRLQAFVARFGREASPEDRQAIVEGGSKAQEVFKRALDVDRETSNTRAKLSQEMLRAMRKTQGTLTQADVDAVHAKVKTLGLDDANKELQAVRAARTNAAAAPATAVNTATPLTKEDVVYHGTVEGQNVTKGAFLTSDPNEAVMYANMRAKQLGKAPKILAVPKSAGVQDSSVVEGHLRAIADHPGEDVTKQVMAPDQTSTSPAVESAPAVTQQGAVTVPPSAPAVAEVPTAPASAVTPQLAADRPDIAKAVDTIKEVTAPPPATEFSIKVGDGNLTVLTEAETKSPQNVDMAIQRLREFSRRELGNVDKTNSKEISRIANKYQKYVGFLQQEGMESRLREEGLKVFDDLPKAGRPTAAQSTAEAKAVREFEAKQREATKLAETRKEASVAEVAGKRSVTPKESFKETFRRAPTQAESYLLETGHSPGESVDQDFQLEFENEHPDLFEEGK